ncbi:MAG: hypothetical protein MUO76_21670 [Anaerolineaceae bacterium]|nr:hypothetical protein [Anaerolineaceae bacterium]
MIAMTLNDVILTLAVSLFILGIVSVGAGIFILVTRVMSEDLRIITTETTRLAQKGIADDVAGLVGNASTLIDSLNQLIRTTTGIGLFLVLIGICLCLSGYFLISRIH